MKQSIINDVKDLFGSGFKKKIKQADSLKELKKRLVQKKEQLEKKIEDSQPGTEQKLMEKKLKVLNKQINKIEDKLG